MKKIISILLAFVTVVSSVGCTVNVQVNDAKSQDTEAQDTEAQDAEETTEEAVTADSEVIHYPDASIKENLPEEKPTAAEDFYLSNNYDYIKETDFPEGYPVYGSSYEIGMQAQSDTLELLESGKISSKYSLISDIYDQYMDSEKRDADGWSGVIPYIDAVEGSEDIKELFDTVYNSDNGLSYLTGLLGFDVDADEKDSRVNACYICPVSLDMEDSAEYTQITDYGQQRKDADTAYYQKLLMKEGYNEADAKRMTEERFELETKLAANIYDLETSYREDYQSMLYNPYTKSELIDLVGTYPIEEMLEAVGISDDTAFIVQQPEYVKALQTIFTDDNLEEIKSYFVIDILKFAAKCTDEEAYDLYNDWYNELNGSSGKETLERRAYTFISNTYSELIGMAYADYYFTEKEKADVEQIVYDLISVYRKRLENIDWLSDETKQIAIEKLDSMGVYVGYPEELYFDYSDMSFDPDADFFTNHVKALGEMLGQKAAKAGCQVNRKAWGNMMAPNVVNAGYLPTSNSIYFPAAILQAPFYSKDASLASNMGGIGNVIGHEITHAFDTNGSQYDKDGNMNNWWTDEDRAAFTERTQAVAGLYGSYETVEGYRVNGDLTIGEAVADLGGACAAMQVLNEAEAAGEEIDYRDYFETNAKIWCMIITEETAVNLLKTNPHAPNCLRCNLTNMQLDKFYEIYDVKDGDFMYTAPENRLKVW